MIRRPSRSTRPATLLPYMSTFRSTTAGLGGETRKSRTCYSLLTAGMLALCGCTSAAGPGPATEAPLLQAQATFGPVASGEANAAILVRDPADAAHGYVVAAAGLGGLEVYEDRKSTRLNSSP